MGLWGWTALKWQTQETVWFFFPPKPLSEKWGYGKNCPEERGNARTSRRLSVVCVWLKRILGLSTWTWAEEEERSSRLFQQIGIQIWGGGEGRAGRQSRGREDVNKWVLKELFPFIALKKKQKTQTKLAAFWISIFHHLIAKLGLRMLARGRADQAAAIEKRGWWRTPWSG